MLDAFPNLARQAAELADDAAHSKRAHIVDGVARSHLLTEIAARLPDAIYTRVPEHLDRSIYTVLSIASQCDDGGVVADALRRDPSRVDGALAQLREALGTRTLIVDGVDRLARGQDELLDVLGEGEGHIRQWILDHARIVGGQAIALGSTAPDVGQPRSSADLEIWERVGRRYGEFQRASARAKILGGAFTGWSKAEIARDVWTGLSDDIRRVLALLVVHGRPIATTQLALASVRSDALEAAVVAGMVAKAGGRIWLADEWTLLRDHLAPSQVDAARRSLAEAFAAAAAVDPMAVLEAHRHLAALGDLSRAAKFAEFGSLLLLDLARRSSLAKRYADAIRGYQAVLDLDEQLHVAGAESGIGERSRAYAIHYAAYNRYRAGAHASPLETLARYREALTLWPQHALFWSRTIACCFIAGKWDEAVRARDEAFRQVPPHPNRSTLLIQRTVERLLERQMVLPALLVWDGRAGEALTQKQVTLRLLEAANSFESSEFWAPGGPGLSFTSAQHVAMSVGVDGVTFSALGLERRGATPSVAMRGLIDSALGEATAALERFAEPMPDWLTSLDRAALSRSDNERVRWIAGLVRLRERPSAQREGVLDVLRRVQNAAPGVRRPTMGPGADEKTYYLAWSYHDRPDLTLEVEVSADGGFEWFFREGDASEGSDSISATLPERVFSLARRFT